MPAITDEEMEDLLRDLVWTATGSEQQIFNTTHFIATELPGWKVTLTLSINKAIASVEATKGGVVVWSDRFLVHDRDIKTVSPILKWFFAAYDRLQNEVKATSVGGDFESRDYYAELGDFILRDRSLQGA